MKELTYLSKSCEKFGMNPFQQQVTGSNLKASEDVSETSYYLAVSLLHAVNMAGRSTWRNYHNTVEHA
jgi:hypothetical protein